MRPVEVNVSHSLGIADVFKSLKTRAAHLDETSGSGLVLDELKLGLCSLK